MKILHIARSDELQKDSGPKLTVGKPLNRIARARFFSRFRRSSVVETSEKKAGVHVSWKKNEHLDVGPSSLFQYNQDCDSNTNANQDDGVSALTNIICASSIATAETSIPTDGSTDATTSTESSFCQERENSFLHETDTSMETKEVLIPTVDGQIETQRQEYILTDMHQVGAETHDQRLQLEEDNSFAPFAFDDDMKIDDADFLSQSSGSQGFVVVLRRRQPV
jgi:hypothetical protein